MVNVATRSGSNTVHGSLFEYFRNEDLNARNYFATCHCTQAHVSPQPVRRNAWRAGAA